MANPKIEYDIYETYSFFKKKEEKLKTKLSKAVESGKMDSLKAREEWDMFLSMLIYLEVCVGMAEDEKYLQDNTFSMKHLYAVRENKSKGNEALRKVLQAL